MGSTGKDKGRGVDRRILGGSHQDRMLGQLIERTESLQNTQTEMGNELRSLIATHLDIKNTMLRLSDRFDAHTEHDQLSFNALTASNSALGTKLDLLSTTIAAATTAGVIQKVQIATGWKVLATIGAIVLGIMGIFAIFFNHPSGH